jgi:protein-tyrosine-phosphatase
MVQQERKSIIFLDTYNLTNSLIAESYLRRMGNNLFNISSAGTSVMGPSNKDCNMLYKSTRLILSELSLPVVGLRAGVGCENYQNKHFDYVVILSKDARMYNPFFLGSYIRMVWDLRIDEINPGEIKSEKDLIKKMRYIRYAIINHIDAFLKSFIIKRRSFF